MNYSNPELADGLAIRYVLGTMSSKVRQRFAHLMMSHRNLQHAVWHWEQLLSPMTDQLTRVKPSAAVWSGIKHQLGWQGVLGSKAKRFSLSSLVSNFVAVAATLVLAVSFWIQSSQPLPVEAIAQLNTSINTTAWVVKRQGDRMIVTSDSLPIVTSAQDFELWMLPESGLPPVSLGLLPKDGEITLLDKKFIAELMRSGLAVSVEPRGGSPTGQPTGPVILTAQWVLI